MHTLSNHLLPTIALLESTGGLDGTDGPDLGRYLAICAALIAATAGIAWGFRRFVGTFVHRRAAQRSLQIIDVLPLGRRQRLCVVRCYDRTFALGVGDREVGLVAELDAVVGEEKAVEIAPTHADRLAFTEALRRVREAMPSPKASAPAAKVAAQAPSGHSRAEALARAEVAARARARERTAAPQALREDGVLG